MRGCKSALLGAPISRGLPPRGWRRRALPGFAIAASLAVSSPGAAQVTVTDRASLAPADVARAIITADNARDLAAVVALYAEDAELWPPGEPPVRGAPAIEARYSRIFATGRPNLRTTIHRVRRASGWALVEGETHGTVAPTAGGEPRRVDDKYLMVLEQSRAQGWEIVRLMWSSN